MPTRVTPTVRLRRLAARLRRLRSGAGLTREDVAERTGINPATLYRIENAKVRPQARTLSALLTLYEVDDETRASMVKLLKDSTQRGWLQQYQGELPDEYGTYVEFEGEARAIWNYQSLFVPGLLQTEDYARAVIEGGWPALAPEEIQHRVGARVERQAVLTGESPVQLWAICDEAVLHRVVGGTQVMEAQLMHLVDAAKQPNITVQIIPFDAGAHPGMPGSFVVLDFEADPNVVYIDSMAGDLFLEEEVEVRRYSGIYEHLRAIALSPKASVELITRRAQSLK